MTHEAARRLSLVGPLARAVPGTTSTSRRDHPRLPFDGLGVRVAGQTDGDVLARVRVFVEEIAESRRLIDALPPTRPGNGDRGRRRARICVGMGGVGARRVAGLGRSRRRTACLRKARLRPAGVRNWRAFDDAVRAQNVFTDVPIIEASFWLTVAGFAR